jgi:hypothetical protein
MKNNQRIPSGSLDCHKAYCRAALLHRIRAKDEDDIMPPKGDPLSPKEVCWKQDNRAGLHAGGAWQTVTRPEWIFIR